VSSGGQGGREFRKFVTGVGPGSKKKEEGRHSDGRAWPACNGDWEDITGKRDSRWFHKFRTLRSRGDGEKITG